MAPITATISKGKVDMHGRDEDHRAADSWFNEEYKKIKGRQSTVKVLDPKKFGYLVKGAFIEITRVRGDESKSEKVEVLPGLYDLNLLQRITSDMSKAKTPVAEITQALAVDAVVRFGVALATESEGALGRKATINLAPVPGGYVPVPNIELPIVGTPVLFSGEGYSFGTFTSQEDFAKWLPAIQSAWVHHNGWCIDLPTARVSDMVDQADATLSALNDQIKNLPGISVYTIAPRWLRYFSDGNMDTQKSGEYGRRMAPLPMGGMRPLIYDAPAWVVGLRIGSKMIPGRVFVTPEGRFIGSDWCQRESDKNGGIDLHTGQYTKHTLMSWCAGPGISRFGQNDPTIAKAHGTVRRLIARPQGDITLAKRAARVKLMKLLVTVKAKGDLRAGRVVDNHATQGESLRYFQTDGSPNSTKWPQFGGQDIFMVGFTARFGKYVHQLTVPCNDDGIIIPHYAKYERGVWTQGYTAEMERDETASFAVVDDELAKEIVATMKEAF